MRLYDYVGRGHLKWRADRREPGALSNDGAGGVKFQVKTDKSLEQIKQTVVMPMNPIPFPCP